MIPLLRPDPPAPHEWIPIYRRSFDRGRLSNFGPCYDDAKEMLRQITGRRAVLTSNGTTALQTALRTVFKAGDRVAVPDFTFAATAAAVVGAGMVSVLFPSDPDTWTIDPEWLWGQRDNYDGFIVVSPFGYRVDFEGYDNLSFGTSRPVVYDCAAAWGMDIPIERAAGPIVYSFHGTKNGGIGEGGAVLFRECEQGRRAEQYINFDFDKFRYCQTFSGINGKMDELHCAMLTASLVRDTELDTRIARHKHLIDEYQTDLEGIVEPHELHVGAAPQVAVLRTKIADDLDLRGKHAGIEFRRYYWPLLSDMEPDPPVRVIAKSPEYFNRCIAFPSDLRGDEYGRVIDFVKRVYNDA